MATNLAALLARRGREVILVDCDVEAPNDHLFLAPIDPTSEEVTVPVAEVQPELCTACGACRDVCAYGAPRILGGSALVFSELCHGCGLCSTVCPTGAMREVPRVVGDVLAGPTRIGGLALVFGRLAIGDVKAPQVIRAARRRGQRRAADMVILDAPPGVSCSAVASLHGVDGLLLVTEPTPFGLHDLALTVELGRELGLPMVVVANRAQDAVVDEAGGLAERCAGWGLPLVGRIPFDRRIAEAYAEGRLAFEAVPGFAASLDPVLALAPDFTGAAAAPASVKAGGGEGCAS